MQIIVIMFLMCAFPLFLLFVLPCPDLPRFRTSPFLGLSSVVLTSPSSAVPVVRTARVPDIYVYTANILMLKLLKQITKSTGITRSTGGVIVARAMGFYY